VRHGDEPPDIGRQWGDLPTPRKGWLPVRAGPSPADASPSSGRSLAQRPVVVKHDRMSQARHGVPRRGGRRLRTVTESALLSGPPYQLSQRCNPSNGVRQATSRRPVRSFHSFSRALAPRAPSTAITELQHHQYVTDTSEAEAQLAAAVARMQAAHGRGDWDELGHAFMAQIAAERNLAWVRGDRYAVPIDLEIAWDVGAPLPHVLVLQP
jgi:hypothetical protein